MGRRPWIVSVQSRLGSTRLPGKVLLPIGQKRIIERVMTRCRENTVVEQTVLAIGDRPENEALTEWASRNGCEYVVGSENDLLDRHRAVARHYEAEILVRVTGDCPFVPTEEIERLVDAHCENSAVYTTNVGNNIPNGIAVDVVERDILKELAELGESHPVLRLRENPSNWRVSFDRPREWQEFKNCHLAVDTPADYWALTDAVKRVGDDPKAVAEWCRGNRPLD